MNDTYTFSNTTAGRNLRTKLHVDLLLEDYTCREYSETLTVAGGNLVTLLKLERTGKRPGEGRIAADMKSWDKRRKNAL